MDILCTNHEYVTKLINIAKSYSTYYAWGAFGAPASYKNNKERYKVPNAPDSAFLFDCAGFVYKAVPWGWYGDHQRVYGGAGYPSKPGEKYYELNTNDILSICSEVSTDFSKIEAGEVLWMSGHVGLYISDGKCVECTSKWDNKCLFSEVTNCGIQTGLPYKRTWTKHGKMPFLKYVNVDPVNPDNVQLEQEKIDEIRKSLNELEVLIHG